MGEIKSVSFTGHRPERLAGYDKTVGVNVDVCVFLREIIKYLKSKGYTRFITGGALGVDQWACDIVLEDPTIESLIAIPFSGYGENWPPPAQAVFHKLKQRSKVHICCPGGYFENGKAQTYKNHVRNQWMIDNSDAVVAIWDGGKEGGTASAVRASKKAGKSIVHWNPKTTPHIQWTDESTLF